MQKTHGRRPEIFHSYLIHSQKLFLVAEFLWQKKCFFWRPCRSKVLQRSGNFSPKVRKHFWKKNRRKFFLSESPLDTWKRVIPTINLIFTKAQTNPLKIGNDLRKKKENNFFLRNCLWTNRIDYIKSSQISIEIAKKFTQSVRKTINITFPQNLCILSKLSYGLSECIFDTPAGMISSILCESFRLKFQKKIR